MNESSTSALLDSEQNCALWPKSAKSWVLPHKSFLGQISCSAALCDEENTWTVAWWHGRFHKRILGHLGTHWNTNTVKKVSKKHKYKKENIQKSKIWMLRQKSLNTSLSPTLTSHMGTHNLSQGQIISISVTFTSLNINSHYVEMQLSEEQHLRQNWKRRQSFICWVTGGGGECHRCKDVRVLLMEQILSWSTIVFGFRLRGGVEVDLVMVIYNRGGSGLELAQDRSPTGKLRIFNVTLYRGTTSYYWVQCG